MGYPKSLKNPERKLKMGADFCCEILTWDCERKLNWNAGKKLINSLEYDDKQEIDFNGYTATKDELLGFLQDIKEASENNRRDTSVLNILNLNMMITGGVTWGDNPSDTYSAISNLNNVNNLFETIGFNKDEIDFKRIILKLLKNKELAPLLMGYDEYLDKMITEVLKKGK
jgi:hypothetical protein